MSTLILIITAVSSVVSAIIFITPDKIISFLPNQQLFFGFTIVFIAILLYLLKNETHIDGETFVGDKGIYKNLALIANLALAILSVFIIYQNMIMGYPLMQYISPVLAIFASGFLTLNTLLFEKREKINEKTIVFSIFPLFYVIIELVLLFKTFSSDPILADFVLAIIAIFAVAFVLYQFTSIYFSEKKKNYFYFGFYFSVFTMLTLVFSTIFSIYFVEQSVILTETVKIIILNVCVNIYLLQFAIKNKSIH